jgi:hypothetical protein
VNGQAQRRIAPHRIRVGGAHFEQMVAGIQIGERDPALRAQVDPLVG